MLDALGETYTMLIAFYLAARLFMASYYFCLAWVIPMVRPMMLAHVGLTIIPGVLWIASIYVDMPQRLALIWVSIFIELCGAMGVVIVIRSSKMFPKRIGDVIDRLFEFFPAINIEHKVERTNAFVTLVLGYSVVSIIYQNAASFGLNAFFGKAALGLVQAFCFNWIYFELDGADLYTHAIRRSAASGKLFSQHFVNQRANNNSAMAWTTAHIPFIMSFVLAAAALSKLVLATDCRDTKIEDLTATYMLKSEPEIPIGLRWFYCAGLGIALFCMGKSPALFLFTLH